jgi:hypothetical protein
MGGAFTLTNNSGNNTGSNVSVNGNILTITPPSGSSLSGVLPPTDLKVIFVLTNSNNQDVKFTGYVTNVTTEQATIQVVTGPVNEGPFLIKGYVLNFDY